MSRKTIQTVCMLLLSLGVVRAGLAAEASARARASYLAGIEPAPELGLTDQSGHVVRVADLRGRVVLLSFVYTRCPGACPIVVHKYEELAQAFSARGWLGDRVRLVLVTLDPEHDTPAALWEFADQLKASNDQWHFLTGSPAQIRQALDRYHIWRARRPDGVIDHVLRIYLIDNHGQVREIYNTALFSFTAVLEDIESLLVK